MSPQKPYRRIYGTCDQLVRIIITIRQKDQHVEQFSFRNPRELPGLLSIFLVSQNHMDPT